MANIPYPESMAKEVAELVARNGNLNVNRMMGHSLPVLEGFSKLGRGILIKGKLDPALRELAILRIGVNSGSEYEWHQHVGFARAVGTREAAIIAVKTKNLSELTDLERLVVDFADQFHLELQVSGDVLDRAKATFDPERLVELAITCGYYMMTAGFLKTFAIEVEASAPALGDAVATRLASAQTKV